MDGKIQNLIKLDEHGMEVTKKGLTNVHMIFEKDNKIVASIYPNADEISDFSKAHSLIEKIIDDFNKKMPYYKKISEFVIRENEFEKTTTKKIKRSIENVR